MITYIFIIIITRAHVRLGIVASALGEDQKMPPLGLGSLGQLNQEIKFSIFHHIGVKVTPMDAGYCHD